MALSSNEKDFGQVVSGAITDADGRLVVVSNAPGVNSIGASAAGNTTVAIGAASVTVLAANAGRVGLKVVNNGATNITLSLGVSPAVAGSGIYIPAGGSWDGTVSGRLWTGAIYGIGSGAGGTLAVVEL
ncbi:MAG: hypothetical protein KGL39_57885 [Patescibacteria group bacterium]|nr:hypothetical protein [Patescibacteria group bacterium]